MPKSTGTSPSDCSEGQIHRQDQHRACHSTDETRSAMSEVLQVTQRCGLTAEMQHVIDQRTLISQKVVQGGFRHIPREWIPKLKDDLSSNNTRQ
jgi:hypothetical protein